MKGDRPEGDPFQRICEILNHDRAWSLYALGDLAPEELTHCEWRFTYDSRDGKEKEGTFFSPDQVQNGIYFGIRDHGWLVAAAGTHLINRSESVAAVGNVFCLPAYRGKGLGARVTSAVLSALIKKGIRTIGLNVGLENPATKLYHRLGFRKVCSYVEGTVSLRE